MRQQNSNEVNANVIKNTGEINASLVLAEKFSADSPILRLSSDSPILKAILRSLYISAVEEQIMLELNIQSARDRNRFENLVVKPAQSVLGLLNEAGTDNPVKKVAVTALKTKLITLSNDNPFKENDQLLESIKLHFKTISDLLAQHYQDPAQRPSVDDVLKEVDEFTAENHLLPTPHQPQKRLDSEQAQQQQLATSYAMGAGLAKNERFKILNHAIENKYFDTLFTSAVLIIHAATAVESINPSLLKNNMLQLLIDAKLNIAKYHQTYSEENLSVSLRGSALDPTSSININNGPRPVPAGKATANDEEVAEAARANIGFAGK